MKEIPSAGFSPWRVALLRSNKAFLPEVRAYEVALAQQGFQPVVLANSESGVIGDYEVALVFLGRFPRWRRLPAVVVADCASLSVGPFASLKDLVKKWTNVRPAFGVYQSDLIRHRMGSAKKYGFRTMGYFPDLVPHRTSPPEVDFVYVGAGDRPGLGEALSMVRAHGYSLRVVGFERKRGFPEAEYLGSSSIEAAYEAMGTARYGLNYVPNVSPFKSQASTKLIEYLACGLGVVSSRTPWVEGYVAERNARVAWLDDDISPKALADFKMESGDLAGLDWPSVIRGSGVLEYLVSLRSRTGD